MHLVAAIRPPWQIVAHLEAAIRPEWEQSENDAIRWTYPGHWRIQLAAFGDVVRSDIPALCEMLSDQISSYPPPTLRLSGSRADPDRADGIWVGLDGDCDTVAEIAQSIPLWVAQFGFALDRRAYSAEVQLARTGLRDHDHPAERCAARLHEYEGHPWVPDGVTIGRETPATRESSAGFAVVATAFFDGMKNGPTA
jgi:2'-5' RNA ligase